MKRIKILCDWTSSEDLFNMIKIQSQDGNGVWDNIQLTYENNNIDYYIIINSPVLHDSQEMQYHEPGKSIIWVVEHKKSWWRKVYKYDKFLQDKNYLRHLTFENSLNWGQFHIGLSYNELMHNDVCKEKILCTVTSSSNTTKLQKKRVRFLEFLKKQNLDFLETPFEHYGRGYRSDSSYFNRPIPKLRKEIGLLFGRGYALDTPYYYHKGSLPEHRKEIALLPFKYSIAVESFEDENYITEKLFDSILCECLTFYYGCPNVSKWINSEAYILLDLNNFRKSYNIIRDSILNNEWEKRNEVIQQEKVKICNQYNFFPRLAKIINEIDGA